MYWDNQSDKTEGSIGIWIGVWNRVESALCHWFLTEKGNIIARTRVQDVTRDEAGKSEIQQIIRNHHITLDFPIGVNVFR